MGGGLNGKEGWVGRARSMGGEAGRGGGAEEGSETWGALDRWEAWEALCVAPGSTGLWECWELLEAPGKALALQVSERPLDAHVRVVGGDEGEATVPKKR